MYALDISSLALNIAGIFVEISKPLLILRRTNIRSHPIFYLLILNSPFSLFRSCLACQYGLEYLNEGSALPDNPDEMAPPAEPPLNR